MELAWYAFWAVGCGILAAIMVWSYAGRRRGEKEECARCGYSLAGLDKRQCPECGSRRRRVPLETPSISRYLVASTPVLNWIVNAVVLVLILGPSVQMEGQLFVAALIGLPSLAILLVALLMLKRRPMRMLILTVLCGIAGSDSLMWWDFYAAEFGMTDAQGGLVFVFAPIYGIAAAGFGCALGILLSWCMDGIFRH